MSLYILPPPPPPPRDGISLYVPNVATILYDWIKTLQTITLGAIEFVLGLYFVPQNTAKCNLESYCVCNRPFELHPRLISYLLTI